MTNKEEIAVKKEAAMEGLKNQLRQLALDQIKENVVASKLIIMEHGKERTVMMQNEAAVKGNIEGTEMVIRATKDYIKALDQEEKKGK